VFRPRKLRPDPERPYRTWGYPVSARVFLLASVAMILAACAGTSMGPRVRKASAFPLGFPDEGPDGAKLSVHLSGGDGHNAVLHGLHLGGGDPHVLGNAKVLLQSRVASPRHGRRQVHQKRGLWIQNIAVPCGVVERPVCCRSAFRFHGTPSESVSLARVTTGALLGPGSPTQEARRPRTPEAGPAELRLSFRSRTGDVIFKRESGAGTRVTSLRRLEERSNGIKASIDQ
jgi:hypothetical protein